MKSYEPSKVKRFEISKDEESQERLKTVLYAFRALNRAVPELQIGFSLFGSLSRGKKIDQGNEGSTDIDLCIFFNDEVLKDFDVFKSVYQNIEKLIYGVNEPFDDNYYKNTSLSARDSKIGLMISLYLMRKIGKKYDLQYFFQKINEELILNDPDFFEDVYAVRNIYLIALFGLDVGGGLKKYQKKFVETLLKFDKVKRDMIWKRIAERLKTGERGYKEIPEKVLKQYPEDFDKLCKSLKISLDK